MVNDKPELQWGWWGEPWPSAEYPAGICDNPNDQVPTPVGEQCLHCTEVIVDGDQGVRQPFLTLDENKQPSTKRANIHIECSIRSVMGGMAHLEGRCSCNGGTDIPDHSRADALAVREWLKTHAR